MVQKYEMKVKPKSKAKSKSMSKPMSKPKKPNGSLHKQMIKDLTQIANKGINMNSKKPQINRKKKKT